MKCGKSPVARIIGIVLVALGALIVLLCVPFRFWAAVFGLILIAAGVALLIV